MHSQVGRFSITFELIERFPEATAEMFSKLKFLPTWAEAFYHEECIEYVGYSPKFRKIEKGEMIPTYEIITRKNDHGTITSVTVKEVKGK